MMRRVADLPDAGVITRLGRGVIVGPGAPAPEHWAGADRVVIDDDTLRDPSAALDALHEQWSQRIPVVVELQCSVDELRAPEIELGRRRGRSRPASSSAASASTSSTRANNYDDRVGRMVWGPTRRGTTPRRDARPTSPTSCSPTARRRGATADRGGRHRGSRRSRPGPSQQSRAAHARSRSRGHHRRRARGRSTRGGRARHGRGARHRARGFGQDARAHRALPPARRPRLEPGLDHRGRVQRAGQGHDAGAARRHARRGAPPGPHAALARQRRAPPRRRQHARSSTSGRCGAASKRSCR